MSPFVYAALLPHSPWLIPEVGGGRERAAVRTIAAARRIGRELGQFALDTVVILTPHGPPADQPGVYAAPRLRADFAAYGADDLALERDSDTDLAAALIAAGLAPIESDALDRGVATPLYFTARSIGAARLLAVAVPSLAQTPNRTALATVGERIAAAAARGRRAALLTSGELSHRLFPGAPGGYEPRAEPFDAAVQAAIAAGDLRAAVELPDELIAAMDEHALGPLAVAAGALAGLPLLRHVNASAGAYEAPFGVGYLTATLYRANR